jgi:hypothetical protein
VPAKKRQVFVIEFLYADNQQLFQTFAWLTEEEAVVTDAYLTQLQERGDITGTGDEGSGDLIQVWGMKPHKSMYGLVKEFRNNTAFYDARLEGIKLVQPRKKGTHAKEA